MSLPQTKQLQLAALGARIRLLRESTGLSQEAFAAEAGFDRAYYGGIERGERNVSAKNLIQIAFSLGVEVGALFPPVEEIPGVRETMAGYRSPARKP